jgi:hypothetical protein
MSLLLRRIQAFERWDNPDDYTVHDGDRTVGRIFNASAGHPEDTPWMWTVEFHQRQDRPGPHQGYVTTLVEAMAAFRESWDRGRSGPR